MNDPDSQMSDFLRRDAENIKDEPFDLKLHQAMMRRIRQPQSGNPLQAPWRSHPAISLGAATAVCILAVVLIWRPFSDPTANIAIFETLPASALSYREAMEEGEAALLAMLDRDARDLLPRSAPIFQSNF